MKKIEKEYIVDQLNEIINCPKISKKNFEKLVVIRERIKRIEEPNLLKKVIREFLRLFLNG